MQQVVVANVRINRPSCNISFSDLLMFCCLLCRLYGEFQTWNSKLSQVRRPLTTLGQKASWTYSTAYSTRRDNGHYMTYAVCVFVYGYG